MTTRISKITSYVIYILAFSLVCSLASQVQMALSAWSWGHSMRSLYSVFELLRHFPQNIFYAVLQVVVAILTIRLLSLRKLFYLSCAFTVIDVLVTGLHRQMMTMLGGLSFPVYMIGPLLPYVAPVMILALAGRERIPPEPAPDVETEPAGTEAASASDKRGKFRVLCTRYWYVFDIVLIILGLVKK